MIYYTLFRGLGEKDGTGMMLTPASLLAYFVVCEVTGTPE
jgi:hypothetical protein